MRARIFFASRIFVLLLVVIGGGFVLPTEAESASATDVITPSITPSELVRGQKGFGLSVFAGHEPERFEVEVIGVLPNTSPGMSFILARLSGQDLERSGVAAGMSGSPVYFDGRLAGAVAFSYNFGLDAIAGITPISSMRKLSDLPIPATPSTVRTSINTGAVSNDGSASSFTTWENLVKRQFSQEQLDHHLKRLLGRGQGLASERNGASSSVVWTAAGFGEPVAGWIDQAVGGLRPTGMAASGGSTATQQEDLVAGSGVALVLVEGDLNLAAHGTVTERQGNEILAFGHPIFSLGPIGLPLASSEVVTIIANASNSFKVSNAGPVIGVFDQDREAGARGFLGQPPPMTPLRVSLSGLEEQDFQMRIAHLPQMRPMLTAVAALGSLNTGSYSGGAQGIDLEARYTLADYGDLHIRQSFDGDDAAVASILYLLNFGAFLDLNTFAKVDIEAIDVQLKQVAQPRSASLLSAHTERQRVKPGERVPVILELQALRGEKFRHRMEVDVPKDVPDGKYVVLIGDGTSMDAVRLTVERTEPQDFEQALEQLRGFHSRHDLQVFGLVSQPGLALKGSVLPGLPGSMREIFAASGNPEGTKLGLNIIHEQLQTFERPLEGVVRIDLEVRRQGH